MGRSSRLGSFIVAFLVTPAHAVLPDEEVAARLLAEKQKIVRADYRADLAVLARAHQALHRFGSHPELGPFAHYWSGFASWRLAMNCVNRGAAPLDQKETLVEGLHAFEAAIQMRPDFADAEAGAASICGWLTSLHSDPDSIRYYAQAARQHGKRSLELEPHNPRVLWVEGGAAFFAPAEFGGDQERGMKLWQRALAACDSVPAGDPLAPDWGRAEALMALGAGQFYKQVPNDVEARRCARAALQLQPDWFYVRDVLLPLIEARLDSKSSRPGTARTPEN